MDTWTGILSKEMLKNYILERKKSLTMLMTNDRFAKSLNNLENNKHVIYALY